MNTDVALFWIQESIKTGAMLAAPILGIALAVGLMVSLFQAITSIQEMTLSYIPKMVAVGIILLLFAPWLIQMLIPAFVISELRIAFQIGFMLFLPFLIVDLIVASVLMSMGMMMLPPVMISLPVKLLLFVLTDGWYLIVESVVRGYMGG